MRPTFEDAAVLESRARAYVSSRGHEWPAIVEVFDRAPWCDLPLDACCVSRTVAGFVVSYRVVYERAGRGQPMSFRLERVS